MYIDYLWFEVTVRGHFKWDFAKISCGPGSIHFFITTLDDKIEDTTLKFVDDNKLEGLAVTLEDRIRIQHDLVKLQQNENH